MSILSDNTVVTISYIGKLDNGEIFKITDSDSPITATIGNSELPPTLEETVKTMAVGQTTTVRVPPEEGYGARQKVLLQEIENKEFIERVQPKPGMVITLNANKDGEQIPVPATVMEIKGDIVVVDYNHPLAGHHLTYEVTLLAAA